MLVDTHVLIWMGDDDVRLGAQARDAISSRHPVYYSAMSVLEMVIKSMKGRFRAPEDICTQLDELGLRQMPLVGEHAEALRDVPELLSHDPFDRALVAQAKAEGLEFLTADRVLLGLNLPWIIDAGA